MGKDLISRQAILKHIEKIRQDVQMMDDTHRAGIIMNGMYLCEKAVINQPSAQPEEDCDTCKHGYFGDKECNNCRVRFPNHYERRTNESEK